VNIKAIVITAVLVVAGGAGVYAYLDLFGTPGVAAWESPAKPRCTVPDPPDNAHEVRRLCRKGLGIPESGPDPRQSRAIRINQAGAEAQCVTDCIVVRAKNRAKKTGAPSGQ
jgi:hypothetical protein